jgi:GAF domain-containing protein
VLSSEPYADLSHLFADIERHLLAHRDSGSVLSTLTALAVERVPGAEFAGLTTGGRSEHFVTVAPTHEIVSRIDRIQYELGHGPCVDAILEKTVFNARDLREDVRWPAFGSKAYQTAGIISMLSLRLFFEDDADLIAGMNLYSTKADAFDPVSESIALLLATHGALAIANARHREQADNLRVALKNSRTIGIAMGVLMNQQKITDEQAFDVLRIRQPALPPQTRRHRRRDRTHRRHPHDARHPPPGPRKTMTA